MKKRYIIVGDNNFWYTTTMLITEKQLQEEIQNVKEGIKNGDYHESVDLKEPSELLVYALENSTTKSIQL